MTHRWKMIVSSLAWCCWRSTSSGNGSLLGLLSSMHEWRSDDRENHVGGKLVHRTSKQTMARPSSCQDQHSWLWSNWSWMDQQPYVPDDAKITPETELFEQHCPLSKCRELVSHVHVDVLAEQPSSISPCAQARLLFDSLHQKMRESGKPAIRYVQGCTYPLWINKDVYRFTLT